MPLLISHRAGTAQWVELLCTRWMARGSIRRGARCSLYEKSVQTGPGVRPPSSSLYRDSSAWDNRLGRADHDTPSSTQVRTE